MNKRHQTGFTLYEMLVTTAIMGILLSIFSDQIGAALGMNQRAYQNRQSLNNQLIASVLLDSARTQSPLGTLPAPFTGNGYTSTVFDPSNATLGSSFQQAGLSTNEINDDGFGSQRVRVYQRVTGLTQQVPLYTRSGALVQLTYQVGAIYNTTCALTGSGCNPSATGVPGASAQMTNSNATTWTPTAPDFGTQIFSTLPLQKSMLQTSVDRMDKLRDSLLNYFREKRQLAAADDTTNYYPAPTGPGAPNLSGGNPATNQSCYDGWYDLSAANVNVLAQVGLGQDEFSKTAWGGAIQYCRDYDPTVSGANKIPHYAAIRIHSQVSLGQAPDGAIAGNNVVLTF
ncbi:prepilin-type N-terminal cleavage/methylation domain-containing protein [Chromobacterium piscinae]|uniref:pilus assembly FimT family protein n=1 Tax=Chromobacterium piscinae TaxID=686831 RepID=UPI001E38FC00|nr:prepilin-type N-terminal cleavage/methylation domain-containing protein [Chromobacterium piscinae]